jgi:hypothetical protein
MISRNAIALRIIMLLLTMLQLAACSGGNPSPAQTAATAQAATAAKADNALKLYDQMRTSGSWDLATSLGDELLQKYPGTVAAAQVQKTLAEVRAKAAEQLETRRLTRQWAYNAVPETGGTQYTAAIASKQPLKNTDAKKKTKRIRLVLRQHPKWGQSVYLLLDDATFDCRKGCATLPVHFDDAPAQRMKATIPPTGEPALFIDDDKGFIARIQKAKTVAIDVTIKDDGDQTVVFEVGGFDPAKLPNKPKK